MGTDYVWRGAFENDEVNALHAEAFEHRVLDHRLGRTGQGHSLGWVVRARRADGLVGFVNIAWDGGVHAFVLDTIRRRACLARRGRHPTRSGGGRRSARRRLRMAPRRLRGPPARLLLRRGAVSARPTQA